MINNASQRLDEKYRLMEIVIAEKCVTLQNICLVCNHLLGCQGSVLNGRSGSDLTPH